MVLGQIDKLIFLTILINQNKFKLKKKLPNLTYFYLIIRDFYVTFTLFVRKSLLFYDLSSNFKKVT